MARKVKEQEYAEKRDEILDAAQRLVYSKGYVRMTIGDILAELQISSGAFYHYFDSKPALLEALVERIGQAAAKSFLPIVQDPNLSAIEKFRRYFEASSNWKQMQRDLISSLLGKWYADENAVIRQKLAAASLKGTPLIFEPIICQGIEEGVFTTRFPEQVAVIIAGMNLSLADVLVGLWLSKEADEAILQKTAAFMDAYVDSVERILGAPSGSFKVFEADDFKEWWLAIKPEPESTKG